MKKLLILAAACAAALASLVPSATAITGNYQKDFVHDYVGLLVFYDFDDPDGDGDIFVQRCSGTLLADKVTVVTAGHCVEGLDDGRIYWAQSAAPNYDPTAFGGLGGDPTTGYPYFDYGAADTSTFSRADNYGFHNFGGFPNTMDVGVVILDQPHTTPSGNYGALPTAGAIDRYVAQFKSKQDARFVSSGYGLSDQDPRPVSFRERLMANVIPGQRPGADDGLQPEDDRESRAGQGRDVQRRLGRPDLLRGHQRDRCGDVVRDERPV